MLLLSCIQETMLDGAERPDFERVQDNKKVAMLSHDLKIKETNVAQRRITYWPVVTQIYSPLRPIQLSPQ